jgi:hypothetical protein
MFSYRAYGLDILSDFPMPEFHPLANGRGDVAIRLEPCEPPLHMADDSYVEVQPGEAFLKYQRAGVFRIRNGREIAISPAPGADLALVRLYLVGKVFATLLYQRGLLVLHASAIDVDGQAVCFIGNCHFGKSSLAASLHRGGCRVVADDVTAVDLSAKRPFAIPAFPQLKVDPAVAGLLGYDTESLVELHPLEPRRGLRLTSGFDPAPLPVGLIYLLEPNSVAEQPLGPQDLLIELIRNSFPARLNTSGGAPHLLQCAQLARLAPAMRLGRDDARSPSSELADRIRHALANTRPTLAAEPAAQS